MSYDVKNVHNVQLEWGVSYAKFQLYIANGAGAITRKPSRGGSTNRYNPSADEGYISYVYIPTLVIPWAIGMLPLVNLCMVFPLYISMKLGIKSHFIYEL